MRRFGRRRFLRGSLAAVCVGHASNETPELRPSSTGSLPTAATDPEAPGRRGSIEVGPLDEVLAGTADGPLHVAEAMAWLVALPAHQANAVARAADPELQAGLERVCSRATSGAHTSAAGCRSAGRRAGSSAPATMPTSPERASTGPGARGLDSLPVYIADDLASIGSAVRIEGPAVVTEIVDQPPSGPHCVDAGSP